MLEFSYFNGNKKYEYLPALISYFFIVSTYQSPSFFYQQEELEDRPRAATFLSSLANYSNTIPTASAADPDVKPAPPARMGTLIGVYLPCIQNIFGVILFIRLTWVVGTAGAIQGFLIVLVCCCTVSLVLFKGIFQSVSPL